MTKLNASSEQSLKEQYAKRKRQHLAPPSIKRYVLMKQQNHQTNAHIFKRLSYVAVAASTLLLMSFLLIERSERGLPNADIAVVQIHTLSPEVESLSEHLNSRYASHYHDYLKQKQTFAAHHKKRAMLRDTDDGWQLATCDNEVLQLSDELITALVGMQQIDTQLKTGDMVDIAFDQSGIVLGIVRSGNYLRC